ncbi:prepilin-type N-terminal cleavage/methylation domain-containing protein [bacterium]|nr:prepilin-type N-terminal cleavage/methylation domain-containing protein [bacterium]
MKNRAGGFTLIELVIVIVVIGIVASVASPNIAKLFTTAQLRQEAQMLTITIKNLQGHAALQKAPYTLTFNFENQSYRSSRGESKYNDFPLELRDLTGNAQNLLGDAYSSANFDVSSDHPDYYDNEYAAITNLRSRTPMYQTSRKLPESVRLEFVRDQYNEEYDEDPFTIEFDARGNVEPVLIVLSAARKPEMRYVIDVTYTGQVSFRREDADE